MSKNINARIALKRDTSANWHQYDPVLFNGELILADTDNGLRAKIGDGTKTYTQLPFTDEALRALITDVDNNNSAVVVTKNGESRLLNTFNIIKLTQEEYKELEASGLLDPDALYLTEGDDTTKELIQPDWSDNDENSITYIRNRTHYDIYEENELVTIPEITYTEQITLEDGTVVYTGIIANDAFILEENASYVVQWPDFWVACATSVIDGFYYIGSLYLSNSNEPDSEEPFLLKTDNTGTFTVYCRDNTTFNDLIINKINESVVQLDERFIPDTIARTNEIINYVDTSVETSLNSANSYTDNSVSNSLAESKTYTDTIAEGYLPLTGGTVTGTLILSNSNDASALSNASPALIIGGTPDGPHIEIDGNEIVAKLDATTGTHLYLNDEGKGVVQAGGEFVSKGMATVNRLKISNTSGVSHIQFSRPNNYNYFHIPSDQTGARFGFCLAETLGANSCSLIIGPSNIYPGTDKNISLGTSASGWKGCYLQDGDLNINRSTTIASNTPARINFKVTQTDNNVSSTSYIAVYDDLDTAGNGNNMVIASYSSLYLAAGEGAGSYLTNNPSSNTEHVHICADNSIYFHTNCNTIANATSSVYINSAGKLYGAVWNDYAEYRNQIEEIKPGYCVASTNNGKVYKTTEKFQPCDGIVSDTFGFAIGETDECKTPLAVAGRVLAYCNGDRYSYNAGDTVCAGIDGKVMKMTREEIQEWPDRIVGIVSEIPEYEIWGSSNVKVDGRIWIKLK